MFGNLIDWLISFYYIVGKEYDMSAENLRGSAMIAGETSAAYDDIFTITIVTNRAIGIGAYLTRLGQRVIQVSSSIYRFWELVFQLCVCVF